MVVDCGHDNKTFITEKDDCENYAAERSKNVGIVDKEIQ